MMKFAAFDTLDEAKEYRAQHGGHVVLNREGEGIWFSLAYTVTPILKHPLVRDGDVVNP